jgi:hypothetical protein
MQGMYSCGCVQVTELINHAQLACSSSVSPITLYHVVSNKQAPVRPLGATAVSGAGCLM